MIIFSPGKCSDKTFPRTLKNIDRMHIDSEGKGMTNDDQEESEDISKESGEDPVEHNAKVAPRDAGISPCQENQL